MKEDKELQAKDRLLNLYVDREMTSDKASDYKSQVLENDSNAQREHQEILNVRRELRNYSSEQAAQVLTNLKSEELWQKIESEISKEYREIVPWWRNFSLPSLGFAVACAISAFVFGVQYGSKPVGQSNTTQNYAAQNYPVNLSNAGQTASEGVVSANVQTVQAKDDFHFEFSSNNREILVAADQGSILHRLPIELDSNQLIGVNQSYPMRAKNVDIDWIKSDRQYKLVTSEKAVPVIWVSGNK